ncbi:MAG: 5-histidylcysteine sulfoxide synthase [Gammaproteobacteria bacterium]|nr:5-histidylcysteine sulfoxide synthase [Gammaproteobacteria bacterium]
MSQAAKIISENSNTTTRLDNTVLLTGETPETKREEIRAYFHQTFTLYEKLFDCLATDEAYYVQANPLRHPLIFYYGHTAVFFTNKLHVAKLIPNRLDPDLESMLAIGVDEMSWDDLDVSNYTWPKREEVRVYRQKVRKLVDDFIMNAPLNLPIGWDDPLWIVMMGIEHERIHLETSSVLIRQLPIHLVRATDLFTDCEDRSRVAPINQLLPVKGNNITLGKKRDDRLYGWDNEYGELSIQVKDFKASQFLVSNGEFLEFVQQGGYRNRAYWTDEGWSWRDYTRANHPEFWVPTDTVYRYRTMTQVIDMPWDWPVDVNYLEAKAFCNWKREQTSLSIRLPTEAEWRCLRDAIDTDLPDWNQAPGNINLEHWASACPVDKFKTVMPDGEAFYDVMGNVWQWTETPIEGYPGFEVHPIYDDFSTPTFDGKHNLIKGGSFFSTGNYAIKDSRYAFRRHFHQHAGFRYIESETELTTMSNPYETDELVSQYLDFHYGDEYFQVPNFAKQCAELCISQAEASSVVGAGGRALDLGCAVGRSSFELAKYFDQVVGLDFSARFIGSAVELQQAGIKRYVIKEEGELVSYKEIELSELGLDAAADRCQFMQADACNLNQKYTGYDLIFAGNLIDRLYAPKKFLSMIHERMNEGGLLILASPYTWLQEYTERQEWLGGFKDTSGENYTTLDGLKDILSRHFELLGEPRDIPFVIRETRRKFQHSLSQMTVWQLVK